MITRCLTFESWYSSYEWYRYAIDNKHLEIPMLTDRSPCSDPFFDIYSEVKRPLISGLCRARKNYCIGDRFIYITRIDNKVCKELGINKQLGQIHYCLVASLIVAKIYQSHEDAAKTFSTRQYVKEPEKSLHPPNIIISNKPDTAASKEYCIVSDRSDRKLTPNESTLEDWKYQYSLYYKRKVNKSLPVAECVFESINGDIALITELKTEQVIINDELQMFLKPTPKSSKMNSMGRIVDGKTVNNLLLKFSHGIS